MRGGQALDVGLLEHRGHGFDAGKEILALRQVILGQHAGLARGLEGVVGKQIPAGEDDVVELGEGDEILDERRPVLGAFAQPDGSHLGQRADGLRKSATDGIDTGHEGGGDRAHPGREDSESSAGRFDLDWLREWHGVAPYYVGASNSKARAGPYAQ